MAVECKKLLGGKEINQLYYGSGHLYNQSLFDPSTDQHIELRHSERNKLHLEVSRQQGVLDSHYHYDTMGRLLEQRSSHDEQIIIQRQYRYEAGQLTQLTGHSMVHQLNDISHPNKDSGGYDPLNTFTRHHQYQHDVLGRLTEHKFNNGYNEQATTEHFAFDPTSNRVSVQTDDIAEKAFAHHGRPNELIQNNQRIRYVYDTHGRVHHKAITAINATDAASSVDI